MMMVMIFELASVRAAVENVGADRQKRYRKQIPNMVGRHRGQRTDASVGMSGHVGLSQVAYLPICPWDCVLGKLQNLRGRMKYCAAKR
jgi:hypothetical protein